MQKLDRIQLASSLEELITRKTKSGRHTPAEMQRAGRRVIKRWKIAAKVFRLSKGL